MAAIDPVTGLYTQESLQTDARTILLATLQNIFVTPEDQPFIAQLMTWAETQITANLSSDAIMAQLPNTDMYKQRFAGNEALKKMGLAPLDVGQYLQQEQQYQALLRANGLDALASRQTYADLIGGNVSVAEMESRIVNVYNRINNADTGLLNELQGMLGTGNLSKSDLATSLLMGKQGVSWLQGKIETAGIAAEATLRGMQSTIGAESLQQLGVTRQQAAQGFETVKQLQPSLQNLGDIYKTDTTGLQNELEQEQFQGLLSQRRRKLMTTEENAFAGRSGIATGSLAKSISGQL